MERRAAESDGLVEELLDELRSILAAHCARPPDELGALLRGRAPVRRRVDEHGLEHDREQPAPLGDVQLPAVAAQFAPQRRPRYFELGCLAQGFDLAPALVDELDPRLPAALVRLAADLELELGVAFVLL